MAELHPHFSLRHNSTGDPGAVMWKDKLVTTAIPLTNLAGKHEGKAAFVVASGPSVNKLDISPLKQHLTFCVNGSFLKFSSGDFNPDYAVICDAGFVSERWGIVQETIASDTHCLFTPAVLSRICQLGANVLEGRKVSVIQTHFRHYGQKAMEPADISRLAEKDEELISQDGRIGFSLNPVKGLFSAHTVTHLPLQLCWYMGVRNVFILGMDLSEGNIPARFYEQGSSATSTHLDRDYLRHIEPAFNIAGAMSASHLFRVYNLSENSRLPDTILPKISFRNALDLASAIH